MPRSSCHRWDLSSLFISYLTDFSGNFSLHLTNTNPPLFPLLKVFLRALLWIHLSLQASSCPYYSLLLYYFTAIQMTCRATLASIPLQQLHDFSFYQFLQIVNKSMPSQLPALTLPLLFLFNSHPKHYSIQQHLPFKIEFPGTLNALPRSYLFGYIRSCKILLHYTKPCVT